jgi:hypothetical protein
MEFVYIYIYIYIYIFECVSLFIDLLHFPPFFGFVFQIFFVYSKVLRVSKLMKFEHKWNLCVYIFEYIVIEYYSFLSLKSSKLSTENEMVGEKKKADQDNGV